MSNFQLVTTKHFNGVDFDCYQDTQEQDTQDFWATREQIGQALEYTYPVEAINKIHQRYSDRLDKFSTRVNLTHVEGDRTVTREVTVYNFRGLLEICRYSNMPKADAVMDFLYDIADEIRRTGSYNANKASTETPEDKKRALDLEIARILQSMVEKPVYPLKKITRLALTRRIYKLATGEELPFENEPEISNSRSNSSAQIVMNFDSNNAQSLHKPIYDDNADLVSKLKLLRQHLSLSQEVIAGLIGTTRQSVSRWETGFYNPSNEFSQRINEILALPLEELLRRLAGNIEG